MQLVITGDDGARIVNQQAAVGGAVVAAGPALGWSFERLDFEIRRAFVESDPLSDLAVPIIVYTTMQIPNSIVFEATLSFLGMGIVPPTPSWGGMLADASSNSLYLVAWWLIFVPGTALLMTTLAFNILGVGLRDALDPKSARTARRLRKKKAGGKP